MTKLEFGEKIKRNDSCYGLSCSNCPFTNSNGYCRSTELFSSSNCIPIGWTDKCDEILLALKLKEGLVEKITANIKSAEDITGVKECTYFGRNSTMENNFTYGQALNNLAIYNETITLAKFNNPENDYDWFAHINGKKVFFKEEWLRNIKPVIEEKIVTLSTGEKISESTIIGLMRNVGKEVV